MNAEILSGEQHKKLHPFKFTLWVAIASIMMMFAGLTSAFIVKSNLTGWRTIEMPGVFWASTVVIVLSSFTMILAVKAFKQREMQRYRTMLWATLVLGLVFTVCQIIGFSQLWEMNIRFKGSSGAGQFFYVITGLHALHVLGGIVAVIYFLIKSYTGKVKLYNIVPVEVLGVYWHFIDILWVYLMIFFLIVA
ncbi:MAG: heme-copper oxidase subunit III [Niabella sp.]